MLLRQNFYLVATVPTACGIETVRFTIHIDYHSRLQQYLPLAVLKPYEVNMYSTCQCNGLQQYLPLAVLKPSSQYYHLRKAIVATVPTACGIETIHYLVHSKITIIVATVPTACGIETAVKAVQSISLMSLEVATVPTACGIETT